MKQAAYPRKRLRAEGKRVSRFVELQRDERGYDGKEISTIMAYCPGRPINRHRKKDH